MDFTLSDGNFTNTLGVANYKPKDYFVCTALQEVAPTVSTLVQALDIVLTNYILR